MKTLRGLFRVEIIIILILMIKLILSGFNIYAQKENLSFSSPGGKRNIYSESELLNLLKEKQAKLDKKEMELNDLKREIEENIKELIHLQKNIENMIALQKKARNKKIKQLAVMYANMPADKAAKLMEKLENDIVVNILRSMDAKTAARVLSCMTPKKAVKISEGLTK